MQNVLLTQFTEAWWTSDHCSCTNVGVKGRGISVHNTHCSCECGLHKYVHVSINGTSLRLLFSDQSTDYMYTHDRSHNKMAEWLHEEQQVTRWWCMLIQVSRAWFEIQHPSRLLTVSKLYNIAAGPPPTEWWTMICIVYRQRRPSPPNYISESKETTWNYTPPEWRKIMLVFVGACTYHVHTASSTCFAQL